MGQYFYLKDNNRKVIINGYREYLEGFKNKNILHGIQMKKLGNEKSFEYQTIKKDILKLLQKKKVIFTKEKINVQNEEDINNISLDQYNNAYFEYQNKKYKVNLMGGDIEELEKYKIDKENNIVYSLEKYIAIGNKLSESNFFATNNNNKWHFYPMIKVLFKYLEENSNSNLEFIGDNEPGFKNKIKEQKFYKVSINEDYNQKIQNKVILNNNTKEYIDMKKLIENTAKDSHKFIPILFLLLKPSKKNISEIKDFIDYNIKGIEELNNKFTSDKEKEAFLNTYFNKIIGKWHGNNITTINKEELKNYPEYKDITEDIDFYKQIEIENKQEFQENQEFSIS